MTGTRQARGALDASSAPKRCSVSSNADPGCWPTMISACTSGTPACSVKSRAMGVTGLCAAASIARQRSSWVELP